MAMLAIGDLGKQISNELSRSWQKNTWVEKILIFHRLRHFSRHFLWSVSSCLTAFYLLFIALKGKMSLLRQYEVLVLRYLLSATYIYYIPHHIIKTKGIRSVFNLWTISLKFSFFFFFFLLQCIKVWLYECLVYTHAEKKKINNNWLVAWQYYITENFCLQYCWLLSFAHISSKICKSLKGMGRSDLNL